MSKPLTLRVNNELRLLVLIGGGEFSFGETVTVDEYLLANLPVDRRTVAFLPTASGSSEYATHFGKHLQQRDPSVVTTNVPVYRGRDNRRQKNLDLIRSAGMVYLGGGSTGSLAETITGSPAEEALQQAARAGALIAGIGASASLFGVHMRDTRGSGSLPGMHWLGGTVIETSFERDDDVALRRLMSLPEVEIGIGIPAGTALAVRGDGTTEIIGGGSIAVFRKG